MRTAFRALLIAGILAGLAFIATWQRYGSLDPCEWTIQDETKSSSLSESLVRSRIRIKFLFEGIVNPDFGECIWGWWAFRLDELPEE